MLRRRANLPDSSERVRDALPPPISASGGITAAWEGEALVIRDTRPTPVWAIITGQATNTNRYAWTQINDGDTDATFGATLADGFAATGTSATTGAPAYELHGRTGVPTGAKVQLWPGGDGSFWVFTYYGLAGDDPTTEDYVELIADPVNDEPAFEIVVGTLPVDEQDATTPVVQLQLAEDYDGAGNPGFAQNVYLGGIGSNPVYSSVFSPTQHTVSYTINSQTGGYQVSESGGNVVWQFTAGTLLDLTQLVSLNLTGVTVTGFAVYGGGLTYADVAAAGNNQGNATDITVDTAYVTGGDGTKGVQLTVVGTEAARVLVINASGSNLLVYPPSGHQIDSLGTNAAYTIAAAGGKFFVRARTSQWYAAAAI